MESGRISKYNNFNRITANGGMREWLKRAVLKTAVPETVPGVRIPLPPPRTCQAGNNIAFYMFCYRLALRANSRKPLVSAFRSNCIGGGRGWQAFCPCV